MAEKWRIVPSGFTKNSTVIGEEHGMLCEAADYESATRIVRALEDAEAIREQLAALMMRHSLATGHGDTAQDLLKELDWQLVERDKDAELWQELEQRGWSLIPPDEEYDYWGVELDTDELGIGPDPRAAIRDALDRTRGR